MMNNKLKNLIIPALVVLAIIAQFVVDTSAFRSLIITICIYSIYAMSYDLLLGFTGIASFGHAIYFGLGAYTVAVMSVKLNMSFWVGLIVAIILCIIISFIISMITIRVKNVYFNMVTMALGQLFYVMSLKLSKVTGGDDGLPGVRSVFPDKVVFCIVLLVLLALVYIFCQRLVQSPTGKILQAIRENEGRVGLLGYNVLTAKTLVIQISGILAAIAGAFYVSFVGIAYPATMHSAMTLQALFMVVIGGTGTLHGAILGAVVMRLADTVLSQITSRWMLILGLVFVVMILFFPKGIVGIIQRISQRFRGRAGSRTAEKK